MTLRTRLFVTSLAVAVPLAALVFVVNERFRLADMERDLRQAIASPAIQDAEARCVGADPGPGRRPDGRGLPPPPPGMRGGPPPLEGPPRGGAGGRRGGGPPPTQGPYDWFTYGRDFAPVDARWPAMPDAIRRDLQRGVTAPSATFFTGGGLGIAVGMAAGDTASPCPYIVVRMRPRRGALHDQMMAFAVLFVSVLGAAWIAAGPVIARMRRLGASVRRSAESRYEEPVAFDGASNDELTALARAFSDAGASIRQHVTEVQAREASLRRFVANTTHDVAVPLTVLQGHLAQLEQRAPADDAMRRYVADAMQEAHYMASLIRNLGAAARLEEPAGVEPHPVDLNALVERVVSRHLPHARARHVTIEHAVPERPVSAMADLTLLEQAVSNLADNAVRYNRPGGRVAIVLDVDTSRFSITVRDDGPGVPEAELPTLHARRVRGSDARTRRPDGQGLGLAIAAEACERLGFTLQLSCPAEGGLVATIAGPKADGQQ